MFPDMRKLRGKIVERDTTQEAVAAAIGIDKSTFYRKIKNNGLSFTIEEVKKMVTVIPLTKEEAIEIFLFQQSHDCDTSAPDQQVG